MIEPSPDARFAVYLCRHCWAIHQADEGTEWRHQCADGVATSFGWADRTDFRYLHNQRLLYPDAEPAPAFNEPAGRITGKLILELNGIVTNNATHASVEDLAGKDLERIVHLCEAIVAIQFARTARPGRAS